MDASKRFKDLGAAYLAAIEGAVGCRLDADYPGKTYLLDDLAAALRRFYVEWAPVVDGLTTGEVVLASAGHREPWTELHGAASIAPPLRDSCRETSGIYLMGRLNDPDRIRSLLMFADAMLFWDPLEDSFRGGGLDSGIVDVVLHHLRALRPLIAEGLVVPAQLARARREDGAGEDTIKSHFANTLMWQGALGRGEYERLAQPTGDKAFEVEVSAELMTAKGYLGYAENKLAATFLPDLVVPLMDYGSLSSYQGFCRSLDEQLQARQVLFAHQSLSFETGFLIDPEHLDNAKLLELRSRDVIFRAFRAAVLKAVQRYEDELATRHDASFISDFNMEVQEAFADLKAAALVSNTWKEFVDERYSLATRILAKVAAAPMAGKQMLSELREITLDAGATSAGNLLAAALKTYSRYRNTKVLMDFAAAVRDVHADEEDIRI